MCLLFTRAARQSQETHVTYRQAALVTRWQIVACDSGHLQASVIVATSSRGTRSPRIYPRIQA